MQGQTNQKVQSNKLQRKLRNAPTDAEAKLWQRMRCRQLDNCKFRRQHPYLDFILDFVCLERRVVVEVDGGQHCTASSYDARRTALLEKAGFVVLRFWNNDVLQSIDGVLEVIVQTLHERTTPSPPNPPLEGEG